MTSADKEVQLHFQAYYHQNDAMDIFSKDKNKLRIFSYENPSSKCSGSRKYIATELSKFAKWYLNMRKEIRNFYEIIPMDIPCRLYFDLEYSTEFNPEASSVELFNNFCKFVKELLQSEYNIEINIDESFLILDSSTPKKFSVHVIVHLPGKKLFSSNVEMKKFTDFLYICMLEKDISLVYNGKVNNVGEKIKVPIFDHAVYTKNRNFRLYLSCKLGKDNHLRLSDWCQFYKCKNVPNPIDVQIFFDSLCVPRFYDKYETLPEYKINEEVVKVKVSKAKAVGGGFLYNACKISNNYLEYLKNGYGKTSSFPLLEEFIVNKNKEFVSTADIRAWDIIRIRNNGKIRLIFHIAGCRYCFNLGREHKSNNVYWEVYFDPNLICRQKCFDRECCGRSSIGCQVPSNITQEVINSLSEMGLYQIPFDSFMDSFWNMERDNVTFLEEKEQNESRKRSLVGNDKEFDSLREYKIPKISNEREESLEEVQETSFGEEEDNFIVVDGKIPEKSTDYLKFIIATQQSDYKDSFEFSPTQLSNYRNALEFSIKEEENYKDSFEFSPTQPSSYENNYKTPLTRESINRDIYEIPLPQKGGDENFMTDDESDEDLIQLSSYNSPEVDPLNECFIASTLPVDSPISTTNQSFSKKSNQRNACIVDEHGEVEAVLESSCYTSDSNSPDNADKNSDENIKVNKITKPKEIIDKPRRENCFGIPKKSEVTQTFVKRYNSSEKCKSQFVSPVNGKRRKKFNKEKINRNSFQSRFFSIPENF